MPNSAQDARRDGGAWDGPGIGAGKQKWPERGQLIWRAFPPRRGGKARNASSGNFLTF